MDIAGRKLFVKALIAEGVDTVFAYPGAVVTDLLDELYKSGEIRVVLPRHEQALIHEAEGYARSTGKTAVCLVTSGPGATNTVTGIADAFYDSIPLVIFTGQVPLGLIGNDAFQEVDMVGITRSICKYSVTVRTRTELAKTIKEAFYIAASGKPGPVVIDLPKNIQAEKGSPLYPDSVTIRGYKPPTGVHIGQLKRAWKLLSNAKRPIILAGGGIHISNANEELRKFVETTKIPVLTTVMGRGAIPTTHPYWIGNTGMHGKYACNMAISECDVLLSIGSRFNDRITGDLNEFAPKAQIIHIDIDTASISRNVVVNVPVVADAKEALEEMNKWATEINTVSWMKKIAAWDAEYPMSMPKNIGLTPQKIIEGINASFDNEICVADVGQNQMWATQFIEINEKKKFFTSGGLGTMGFGFPAAIGAKIANPDRPVVCVTGDGGFQMNMQEMATSVLENAPVIICLMNNGVLGMVRQSQQFFYGKRYAATLLRKELPEWHKNPDNKEIEYTPDFMKWADSYGIKGIRVTKEEEILPALEEAKKSDKTVLIEFLISWEEVVLPMVKGGSPIYDMIL